MSQTQVQTLDLRIEENKPIPMGIEEVRIIRDSPYPYYNGQTDVTPGVEEQKLSTADTVVKSDITVEPIPYFQTSNPSGGYTAIIGG